MCWSIYYLMRILRVSRWLAFTLTTWFMVSPGVILFENYMLYEYLVSFLLLLAAVALVHFVQDESWLWAVLFFASLFGLVLVRNIFHLAYFIAIMATLAFLSRARRQTVLLCGVLPLVAILALYAKNWILFGSFSGSTWMGMNMDTITAHQLTSEEARDFVKRGVISAASLLGEAPPVHYQHAGIMPPGAIGSQQLLRGGPLPGYFQPVEIVAPTSVLISTASQGQFDEPDHGRLMAGMLIGAVYRLRVTNIPGQTGLEVYPTVEVIDRLYPPVRRLPVKEQTTTSGAIETILSLSIIIMLSHI